MENINNSGLTELEELQTEKLAKKVTDSILGEIKPFLINKETCQINRNQIGDRINTIEKHLINYKSKIGMAVIASFILSSVAVGLKAFDVGMKIFGGLK